MVKSGFGLSLITVTTFIPSHRLWWQERWGRKTFELEKTQLWVCTRCLTSQSRSLTCRWGRVSYLGDVVYEHQLSRVDSVVPESSCWGSSGDRRVLRRMLASPVIPGVLLWGVKRLSAWGAFWVAEVWACFSAHMEVLVFLFIKNLMCVGKHFLENTERIKIVKYISHSPQKTIDYIWLFFFSHNETFSNLYMTLSKCVLFFLFQLI